MKNYKSQQGITLLEIILTLAVASSILVMTLRISQSWIQQRDIAALRFNVETLFTALGNYYHAQCGITSQNTASPANGTLVTTTTPVAITIANLNGFLPDSWLLSQANNALVDNTSGAGTGYFLQFNATQLSANTNCSANDCVTVTGVPLPSGVGVLIWRAQVAIKLTDTAEAVQLQKALGADCISSITGSTVATCESNPTAGAYLVWERLPSFASPDISSTLWVSMPALKEFNMQYTHDQMFELNANTYSNDGTGDTNEKYYLCGG